VKKIAVFASGAGSNAAKIIEASIQAEKDESNPFEVALIVCNKPGAGVLSVAEKNNIPALLIDKEKFFRGNGYVDELKVAGIDFIVLAGFLWKIPISLIKAFSRKIVNIHPALLPNYGGKGMYGHFVHEAVIANKEKESGITIHYVDELYDHGDIIFQARCPVMDDDTADSLAKRIHQLEHEHYSQVIKELITQLTN
jgi:phosphoribosylglycinamide formyltransferase-1